MVPCQALRGLFGQLAVVRIAVSRHAADMHEAAAALLEERLGKDARSVEIDSLLPGAAAKPIRDMEYHAAAGDRVRQRSVISQIRSHSFDVEPRYAGKLARIGYGSAHPKAPLG